MTDSPRRTEYNRRRKSYWCIACQRTTFDPRCHTDLSHSERGELLKIANHYTRAYLDGRITSGRLSAIIENV